MSFINNSLAATTTTTTTFERHSSYPTSINSNPQSGVFNGRRCSSTTILPSFIDQDFKIKSVNNYRTLDRQIELNLTDNSSWVERCKQRITNILKQISKPTTKQGK
jgi:hypothetical protein